MFLYFTLASLHEPPVECCRYIWKTQYHLVSFVENTHNTLSFANRHKQNNIIRSWFCSSKFIFLKFLIKIRLQLFHLEMNHCHLIIILRLNIKKQTPNTYGLLKARGTTGTGMPAEARVCHVMSAHSIAFSVQRIQLNAQT